MAMKTKTKTKLCLVAAATAVAGAAVGAYFGSQPASDSAALAPMLGGFTLAAIGTVATLITAPWRVLKHTFSGSRPADSGVEANEAYWHDDRFFGDNPGTPRGVPHPSHVGHPLWERYYGPPAGQLGQDR